MRDTGGSKTVAVLLAVTLVGTLAFTVRQTRQDASAGQQIIEDGRSVMFNRSKQ